MHNIEKVIQDNMCSGCGLCVKTEKEMCISDSGFLRPLIPINDVLSARSCPGSAVDHHNGEAPYDVLWGPIFSSNVGYATNEEIRNSGSSGGVISALLDFLITSATVDAVIHTGASDQDPIRNKTYISTTPGEILRNAGSRYAPSSPLSVIRSLIGNKKKYAVVGKPCDIAAMRSLTSSDIELKTQFPYLISFMCAGVPSEEGTLRVLKKLGIKDRRTVSLFRYRGDGWPGLTKAITSSNEEHTMTYNESWGTILNRHLQARCKLCADGIGEAADIVCADAWHESENGYPSFEEAEGRSLILSRTSAGANLLNQAIQAKVIATEKFETSKISEIQPYQSNRKKTALARKLAINLTGSITPKYDKKYRLITAASQSNVTDLIKAFAGTFRRKLKKTL
ncbi:Coenzyme F420 hydrogenase/dehydrogenase, beta subunit C-terminal domain [Pseudomonas sp. R5(2019)]|uniref:Coenzyme F420 hydrogenase/dehydrogenase, beta subunit C-terminal domain n=1 Tax=Pseudomonas sp. R5(2019) TaxID=2697566 RepID=UPI0014122E22|nr:Coenzyme F420 hydrogenase/dehydrogenase, beta subunit C-terminal domain [Pseudomonas sp. R5(2019)]NBA98227.1 coenzyme F420 hydrogenase [Pseudomonas sp. R5(2019)]